MAICDFCGTTPAPTVDAESDVAADVPLTWITSIENGQPRTYCDRCARDHLRSIESKLDSEWW